MDNSGGFTVKFLYNQIKPSKPKKRIFRWIWDDFIPTRISFLVWRIL